ncbi:hypothetical protein ABXS75_16935 [Roseburia hominis]
MKKDISKNRLEHTLRNYYSTPVKSPSPERMQQTLSQARRQMLKLEDFHAEISFWTFFLEQLHFIKKGVWFKQFLVVLLFGLYLFHNSNMTNTIGTLSALLPLCFLAGTRELSRAFVNRTVEMELSTKFTLQQVLLSKITLLGLSDVLVLTLTSITTSLYLSANLLHTFMYFGVPLLLTSFGCLCILNHTCSKDCNYYCWAWGAAMIFITFCLPLRFPALYEAALIWCWCLLFTFALFGVLLECRSLIKNCPENIFKNLTYEYQEELKWNLH